MFFIVFVLGFCFKNYGAKEHRHQGSIAPPCKVEPRKANKYVADDEGFIKVQPLPET
jgi:hypothetical protein